MSCQEFSLIRHIMAEHAGARRADVDVGIGDDAAVLHCPDPGQDLISSVDTLVAGRHFFADADPAGLGHKALAVNLSDLAAMGARPAWALLSLSLPDKAPEGLNDCWPDCWLQAFMTGMDALAQSHGVGIVGGDTVACDTLQISITALGWAARGRAIRRSGAQPGDRIWVSGSLGGAAAALRTIYAERVQTEFLPIQWRAAEWHYLCQRLERPEPRLALGQALLEEGLAHAMLDISDGLLADLGHLLAASDAHARLELGDLPLAEPLRRLRPSAPDLVRELALAGGDDYELCFTAPASADAELAALAARLDLPLSCVGRITNIGGAPGQNPLADARHRMELWEGDVRLPMPERLGYEHFTAS